MAGALETVKTISDVAANVATVIAFGVGAIWAYWAFLRERTRWPRADLKLLISHRVVSPDHVLIHVKVVVQNLGNRRIKAEQVRVDISQVAPVDERVEAALDKVASDSGTDDEDSPFPLAEVEWPSIPGGSEAREFGGDGQPKTPQIEPGETDEFCFDLVVPRGLETIYVYAYVKNVKRRWRELGWEATDFYDIDDPGQRNVEFGSSKPTEPLRSRSTSAGNGPRNQKEPRPSPSPGPRAPGQPEPEESN